MYFEGIQVGPATPSAFPIEESSSATFALAAESITGTAAFSGVLDEVAVYDHALDEKQIAAHKIARTAH